MITEIQKLKKFRNQYENEENDDRFKEAEEYLRKVYDKYGTININQIKNLIK